MAMRGRGSRARSPVTIDVRTFGWERAVVAVLRHPTLAFEPIEATPLTAVHELGKRDRLSLVGQFAAHQALLQFAGVPDSDLDPAEWVVVEKRGADCRLVRAAARRAPADPVPVLTIIQQFAAAVGAPPIDVLRQSSARPDAVYCEIDSRLRADATADLRWFRAAAIGQIASPGIDMIRAILSATNGCFRFDDPECVASMRMASDDLLVVGDSSSPLARYSGISELRRLAPDLDSLSETQVVERVIAAASTQRFPFVLATTDSLDPASRKVIDLLRASEAGVWIGPDGVELPDSRWFVVSPRLTARHDLDKRLAEIPREMQRAKLDLFTTSPCFGRYLVDGVLPSPQMASPTGNIKEPARSYLAAVALLGLSSPIRIASSFLAQFSSTARIEELTFEGVTSIVDDTFVFSSEDMRTAAVEHLPPASRVALARTAAELLDAKPAAMLYLDAGDTARAVEILETIAWASADDAICTLRSVRAEHLSPRLARILAEALVTVARYRDARELLPRLVEDDSESLLARIERRTGDYASALARLERRQGNFADDLLHAELLALTGRYDDADALYQTCIPVTDDDGLLLGYRRAVLAMDRGAKPDRSWMSINSDLRDYYCARFHMYDVIESHDAERALDYARAATAAAHTTAESIDATLDYLFALFTAGRWPEARAAAMDALLLVDETQGDRASGGILFVLAFLCADDGQCAHASHLLDRLRQFYSDVHDEQRLRELDLIAAAIEFARARFDAALAAAESILSSGAAGQIRESAALIADEIVAMTQAVAPPQARGETANVELIDRYRLLRGGGEIRRPFVKALADWRNGAPPVAATTADKLMLMRVALRCRQQRVAIEIAGELGITLDQTAHADDAELRALRIATTREFPFAPHDFAPCRWRFATRNRLGQWNEIGSLPALSGAELDRILESDEADWIACSDRELLYFKGLRNWSVDSRTALAATFRIRSEHYRLRRMVEQEEAEPARGTEALEGIVGQSPEIHEICALVSRIAKRDVPVCILGESGTGKELIARAIHRQSPRKHKAFTTVNCAALPENLIESELFGAARGAFTGADRDRAGLIETSDGGTLFLDEIGELPLAAQAKLLRFLQEGEFRRVGETTLRSCDVRVLTATNRKLEAAVEEGRFREDLYYRIRGVELQVPPLRDRASDIPLLVSHFLGREREKHRSGPTRLSPEAEAAFASYHWPGNVRELQNAMRAAHAIAGDAKQIDLEHLPESLRRIKIARKNAGSYQDAVVRFRRDLIEKSLAQADGNQNQAAAMLKISRQALAYQIRELGILVTSSKRPRA